MENAIMPVVGIEKLYVAKVLTDGTEPPTFDTPKYLAGIKEVGIKPKTDAGEFYAENILWLSETTLASIDVEIDITDLTDADEALLLGHKIATEGGIIKSSSDIAPDVALLIKANKGNGKARYVILYKGKFSTGDEDYKGKEGKSNFQSKKLKATFSPLHSNKMWSFKIDEEQGMTDVKFFASVTIPVPKPVV